MRRIAMASRPAGLDPEDPTVRTAVFGVEVQDWLSGTVGTFVMGRVRIRLSNLQRELKTLDPYVDPSKVLRTQVEISHWEQFAGWLGDAIQAGLEATAIIEGEQDAQDEDG
jgi:hypothetical protein